MPDEDKLQTIARLRNLIADGSSADSEDPSCASTDVQADSSTDITDIDSARQIALRRIEVRARSCAELRKDLLVRHVSSEIADQIVARFLDTGLLNDREFARAWVQSRRSTRSLSSMKLRQELQAKGLNEADITEALAGVDSSDQETALHFARIKIKPLMRLDAATRLRRLTAQLARRGFSYSIIQKTVTAVMDEVTIGTIVDDE